MRSVFDATGGFLGRIDGETCCAFWAEESVVGRLSVEPDAPIEKPPGKVSTYIGEAL